MSAIWTDDEIKKILAELDSKSLPFKKYTLLKENGSVHCIGSGGAAYVFEAWDRADKEKKYAVKVIGFKSRKVDPELFKEAVEVQEKIQRSQDNVVEILDHTTVYVCFDDQDNISDILSTRPYDASGSYLILNFIIMECLTPVISYDENGINKVIERLSDGSEDEVLKLAYDIGSALSYAHRRKILHRDVKPENIFFSEKDEKYKLGDFGVAKETSDGFAATVVYTQGYAAPELADHSGEYDYTADIYSLGMTLYMLLNNLQLPRDPFKLKKPPHASAEFFDVIKKMCMYDPNDRYQSVDEVLSDLVSLMYGERNTFHRDHAEDSLTVSIILMIIGAVVWKLSFAKAIVSWPSIWDFIMAIMVLIQIRLYHTRKSLVLEPVIIGLGTLSLISGFSFGKLVLTVVLCIPSVLGLYAASFVIINSIIEFINSFDLFDIQDYSRYRWAAVLFIILSVIMMLQYYLFSEDDRKTSESRLYLSANRMFYIVFLMLFLVTALFGQELVNHLSVVPGFHESGFIFGINRGIKNVKSTLGTIDFQMLGIGGMAFLVLWIIRDVILYIVYRVRRSKKMK